LSYRSQSEEDAESAIVRDIAGRRGDICDINGCTAVASGSFSFTEGGDIRVGFSKLDGSGEEVWVSHEDFYELNFRPVCP